MDDLISRQAALDALLQCRKHCIDPFDSYHIDIEDAEARIRRVPAAQPETCEGCKHLGKWENEVEYGFLSPCTCCKRRVEDNYERL